MIVPVRLQLSRAKGFDLQALSRATNGLDAVNVARPGRWGNPFRLLQPANLSQARKWGWELDALEGHRRWPTADDAVDHFRRSLLHDRDARDAIKHGLHAKNLACWCKPGAPCHADVLLVIANA